MHFDAEEGELLALASDAPPEARLADGRLGLCPLWGGARDLGHPARPLCKGGAIQQPCSTPPFADRFKPLLIVRLGRLGQPRRACTLPFPLGSGLCIPASARQPDTAIKMKQSN